MFDHWSKNGMIKRLMTDETKDFVRSRIKDYFNISFVHPNPLVNIA